MKIIKSKLQIFAIISWVLAISVVTYNTHDEYVQAKAPLAKEGKKEIIEGYLKAIGIITGICLGAWGIPAIPTSHWLLTGRPMKPFEIGDSKKKHKKKA